MTYRSVLALVLVVACKKNSPPAAGGDKYPGTDDGARQLLGDIRTGDAQTMTTALKPAAADYKAVFVDEVAVRVADGYERLWSASKTAITADPGATELELHKATTDELRQWTDGAAEHFPASYRRAADKLRPGITIYQWKYLKPGNPVGKVYDGLVFVNNHWAWFPKPWRVLGSDAPAGAKD